MLALLSLSACLETHEIRDPLFSPAAVVRPGSGNCVVVWHGAVDLGERPEADLAPVLEALAVPVDVTFLTSLFPTPDFATTVRVVALGPPIDLQEISFVPRTNEAPRCTLDTRYFSAQLAVRAESPDFEAQGEIWISWRVDDLGGLELFVDGNLAAEVSEGLREQVRAVVEEMGEESFGCRGDDVSGDDPAAYHLILGKMDPIPYPFGFRLSHDAQTCSFVFGSSNDDPR